MLQYRVVQPFTLLGQVCVFALDHGPLAFLINYLLVTTIKRKQFSLLRVYVKVVKIAVLKQAGSWLAFPTTLSRFILIDVMAT